MSEENPSGPSPNFITGDVNRIPHPSAGEHERYRAVLAVAAAALDVEDCRSLLQQLGLDPSEGISS